MKNANYYKAFFITPAGRVKANAYYDTGNTMYDPYTHQPVIIMNFLFYKKIYKLNDNFKKSTDLYSIQEVYPICCKTVLGTNFIPCIKSKCIEVISKKKIKKYENISIGISETILPNHSDILLHKTMFF